MLGDTKRSCEFFTGLDPEEDGVAASLAELALHGSGQSGIPLDGDSITLTQPLWPGTRANTFLFSRAVEGILPMLQLPDVEISFVQVTPILPEELELKKNSGSGALWNKFESEQIAYWDPRRK